MHLSYLRTLRISRTGPLHASASARVYRSSTHFYSQQSTSSDGKGNESLNSGEGSTNGKEVQARSAHAQWYSDFLPGMIPIALLGSAVYIGLQLVQTKLANEKYLDEANARIAQLEEEIKRLQSEQEARYRALKACGSTGNASSEGKSSKSRWWWFA